MSFSKAVSTRVCFGLANVIVGVQLLTQPSVLLAAAGDSPRNGDVMTASVTNNVRPENNGIPVSFPSHSASKTGADYLQLARDASDRMFSEVENVICQERVQRYKSHGGDDRQIDVVEANVAVENGEERYSDIQQNHKHRAYMQQIGGAWSQGEYATFLGEARRILGSNEFISQGYLTTLNGVPAVMFPFDMDESSSSWSFAVRSHNYTVAFHGELWISRETGELLRSRRIARHLDVSTGISEVDWTVDFSKVDINGRPLTLPSKALYSVTYLHDDSREWNLTAFSGYKRFGSESTIKFAEVSEQSAVR